MIPCTDSHAHYWMHVPLDKAASWRQEAVREGLVSAILMSTAQGNWDKVRDFAHITKFWYAIGEMPHGGDFSMQRARESVHALEKILPRLQKDALWVGIGRIGLWSESGPADRFLMAEQCRLARLYDVPVSVHSHQTLDRCLKIIRRYPGLRFVLHAFNGSPQQREQALHLGGYLGFGATMSYVGSRRVRMHAQACPVRRFVLETDAPDMLSAQERQLGLTQSQPAALQEYIQVLATLRDQSTLAIAQQNQMNVRALYTRM